MAVKGGQIVQVGNQVLLDRIQTGGPGQVQINETTVYELGNYKSVGKVYDTPDISYNLESIDASAELEALLTGGNFATDAAGTKYDLSTVKPIDVIGQFKAGQSATSPFDVVGSAAAPYLLAESVSYRFGLSENGQQSATLRGDSIFYNAGSMFVQEFASGPGPFVLAEDAYPYNGDVVAGVRYALSVSTTKGRRLRFGVDYTEGATGAGVAKAVTITLAGGFTLTAGEGLRVTYASDTVASYPQLSHAVDSATRPSAIRGRHIVVKVGGVIWTDIQSFTADWRIQIDKDEEFGNSQVVNQDFDVPTVNGGIQVKARSISTLMTKLQQTTGAATSTEVMGALQRAVLPVEVILKSPTDGSVLKTLYSPDCRIALPGFSGRVQTKTTWDFNFSSDSGTLEVYKGAKP